VADVDFATSALVYNSRTWGGFTLDHLLAPKTSFYGNDATVPVKINFLWWHADLKQTRLRQKSQDILSVAINFQKQGNSTSLILGYTIIKIRLYSEFGIGEYHW